MSDTLIKVSKRLHEANLSLVTAESCTGGWVAKQLTDLEYSSFIFDRGFVTYSNQAKMDMLGVSHASLEVYGAVSEEVVKEMVVGALKNSQADIGVSISGIAGPGGGTKDKPVGTVCFSWMKRGGEAIVKSVLLEGDRDKIRKEAVEIAFKGVMKQI